MEYYTVENYNKLKGELNELEERKAELEKEYKTAIKECEEIECRICGLNGEIKKIDKKKEEYLENGTFGVDFLTISIGTSLAVVNGAVSLFKGGVDQSLFWMLNALFITPAIFYGIVCFLRKRLLIKKRNKLRESFEYQKILDELRKIEKERDKNYPKIRKLSCTCQRLLSNLESIKADIALKKQEIINFEREHLSINLTQEDKEQTSHKTRVLANN